MVEYLLTNTVVEAADLELKKFGWSVSIESIPFNWDTDEEGTMQYRNRKGWKFKKIESV